MSISASLLAALVNAVKTKAAGAAAERLVEVARIQAERLRGILPDAKDAEYARMVVAHVLGEAAAFPPNKAIQVVPLSTAADMSGGSVGIWPPDARLAIEALWVNHADFPVWIRDVSFTGRVGGGTHEYEGTRGDEFKLDARSQQKVLLTSQLRPNLPTPTFHQGRANLDLNIRALVSGPWEDDAQTTRQVFNGGVWIPVFVDPQELLTSDPADVDLILDSWFAQRYARRLSGPVTLDLAAVDREHKLAPGSTKKLLVAIANRYECSARVGSSNAQLAPRNMGPGGAPPPIFRR